MSKVKIIEILKHLSERELDHFEKFLEFSVEDRDKKIIEIFRGIREKLPETPFPKRELIQLSFKEFEAPDGYFRKLSSILLKEFKKYLRAKSENQNDIEKELIYLGFLRANDIENLYNVEVEKLTRKRKKNNLDLDPQRKLEDFYLLDFLYRDAIQLGTNKPKENFGEMDEALDYHYLIQKMRNQVEGMRFAQIYIPHTDPNSFPDWIMKNFDMTKENPSLPGLYFKLKELLVLSPEKIKSEFQGAKSLSIEIFPRIGPSLKEEIQTIFINICLRAINSNADQMYFLAEMLGIYQERIQCGQIFQKGVFSQWDYLNLISAALKLGKSELALTFIRNYKEKLPKSQREMAYHYCMATYYYQKREFGLVHESLEPVLKAESIYAISARSICLKSFWEQGEFVPLLVQTDNCIRYITRNTTFSHEKKKRYKNRFDLLKKVAKADSLPTLTAGKLKKLSQLVDESTENPDQEYLHTKLKQMWKRV